MKKEKGPYRLKKTLKGPISKKINAISVSKTSPCVIALAREICYRWDTKSNRLLSRYLMRNSFMTACDLHPNDNAFAVGGLDNSITIYSLSGPMLSTIENGRHEACITSIRFLNEHRLLSSSGDNSCILWDLEHELDMQTFLGHKD